MKFLVDAMFGRLARWLRMSGYDTVYDVNLRDGRMIGIAKEEGRILVTRDRDVTHRAKAEGVRVVCVSSLDFTARLRQMTHEFGVVFQGSPELSRCPICNADLRLTCKKDIKAKVSENVRKHYDRFWVCDSCEKIYWHGGHWKNVRETLDLLRGAKND